MDIGAVERIRPMGQVIAKDRPGDVAPALGVAGARMEEDSYRSSDYGRQRGMDEQPEDDVEEESETLSGENERNSVCLLA